MSEKRRTDPYALFRKLGHIRRPANREELKQMQGATMEWWYINGVNLVALREDGTITSLPDTMKGDKHHSSGSITCYLLRPQGCNHGVGDFPRRLLKDLNQSEIAAICEEPSA